MNKIEVLFNDIIKEARTGEIKYQELLYGTIYDCIFRMKFNVVTDNISKDTFNLYYSDYNELIKKLEEYVYSVIKLYNIDNEYDIKKILILLWSNITNSEMLNINDYVDKYISFINNDILLNKKGSKYIDDLGLLNYSFDIQSYMQETPYCFNAFFSNNGDYYYLPRISYGIIDDKCYIYAIQNKEKNNTNNQVLYGEKLKKKLNTLNSGIKNYRNVTPYSLVSLILFISILSRNNINKFEAVTNLPIRIQNRKLVNDYKLQVKSNYTGYKELEIIKKNMEENEERIIYNTTVKFQNSFKKLVYYFKIILKLSENELSDNLLLEVLSMSTNNELINEIIESEEFNYGKSL